MRHPKVRREGMRNNFVFFFMRPNGTVPRWVTKNKIASRTILSGQNRTKAFLSPLKRDVQKIKHICTKTVSTFFN